MAKFLQPWRSFRWPFPRQFSYLLRRQLKAEEEVELAVVVADDGGGRKEVEEAVVAVAWTMVESLMRVLV